MSLGLVKRIEDGSTRLKIARCKYVGVRRREEDMGINIPFHSGKRFLSSVMTFLILVSVFAGLIHLEPVYGAWWNTDWDYRKTITINHTKVGSALTDFPVLIDITDGDLASKAQDSGYDIAFTDVGGSKLSHEIEVFNGASGKLTAWVKVPSLSSTTDTILYMYYGNSACGDQQNKAGVWDSNYVMVQHLKETSGTHVDSTANGNNATAYNGVAQGTPGKIDGSDTFDGANDYVNCSKPSSLNDITALTYECWVNLDSYGKLESGRFFDKGGIRVFLVATYGIGFLQVFSVNKGQWKTSNPLGFGQWYHVALVYNSSSTSNNPSIYVNGTAQSVAYYDGTTIPSGAVTSDASSDWIAADRSLDFARTYDGSMDEIRISNVSRPAAWISTEYNNQNSPATFYTVGIEEANVPPPPPGPWWNDGWQYRKRLTIYHYSVSTDLTNFPVLVDMTDGDLAAKAQDSGNDIVFTDYDGSKLNHEIELFNGTSGRLTAWVRVPSVSSTTDTILYMYYGNAAVGSQQNRTGVWNSDYVMVQHLKETSGTHSDSTLNNNNAAPYNGVVQGTAGQIDGADSFDGSDDYLKCTSGSTIDNVNPLTYECWVNLDTYGGAAVGRFFDKGRFRLFYAAADSVGYLQNFTSNTGQWKTSSALTTGQWHHVAVTYDDSSTSNNPKIYVDGVSQSVSYYSGLTIPSGTATSDAANDLIVGNRLTLDRGLDGLMDEVRISKTERTAAWISSSYSNQRNPSGFVEVGSEEVGTLNYPPEVSNESPSNGATDVALNPTLSADVYDAHNDSVEWRIEANTTGTWTTLNSGTLSEGRGTVSASTSDVNGYSTKYWWRINATDPLGSGNSTIKLLSFTTRPANYPPSLSGPIPADGITDVATNPTLSIYASDLDLDLMTIIFQINASGIWQTLGTYTDVGDGRYNQSTTNMNGFATKYYWSVSAWDAGSGTWTNRTYSFTTAPVLKLKYATMLPSGMAYDAICPVVGDINGDGIPEIVIRSNGQVCAMRGTDGHVLWTRSYEGWSYPQLADLNNDGRQEILVPIDGSPNCGLVALFGDGSEYWRRNDLGGDRVSLGPAVQVADTNHDGYLEVYFVSASHAGGPITGEISKISHDGIKLASTGPDIYYPCWGGISLGDYDFDGQFEIYLGERSVEYDGTGLGRGVRSWFAENLTHRWDNIHILTSTCAPILADVDGDGKLDVVTNHIDSGVVVLNASDGSYIIDDRYIGVRSHCQGAVYDIDGDGHLELTISDGRTEGDYKGFWVRDLLGRTTVTIDLPYQILFPPRFGDVTGDGKMEMIAAPGLDGSLADYDLFIYNQSYGLIARIPATGAGQLGPPLVADVDGDGLNEVVVAGMTGKLLVYDTIAPTPTPRPRTEVQGYSSYMQNAAEYVPLPGPESPMLLDENPLDGSLNIPTQPTLSVRVFDYQTDPVTVVFRTNASGAWQTIGTYQNGNGIYSQTTNNMNSEGTKYYWEVNATDSTGRSTVKTFSFSTWTFNSTWWNDAWGYRKPITVDHTKVAGQLNDFPILLDLTDADLASHAQSDGDDIVFVDYSGYKMCHEIEHFDAASGHLVVWVCAPGLSSTADTRFYMYYGNPSASNQQNATGVWDSNFIIVHHFAETSGTQHDSTVNHNDVTPQNGVVQGTTGKIDGADQFDGDNDVLTRSGALSGSMGTKYTISVWIDPEDYTDQNPRMFELDNLILFISPGPAGDNHVVNFISIYQKWSDPSVGQWCTYNDTMIVSEGWVHIAVTYDGSSAANKPIVYKNGVPLSIWEWNTPTGSFNPSYQNLYIGDRAAGDRSYHGKIDELHFSNAIRSSAWVQTEYNNQRDPTGFYTLGSEQQRQTSIIVDPTISNVSLGGDCIVRVNVTDVADLYAWEFQLSYNQTILDLTSTSVITGGLNEPTNTYHNLTDEANGHLWWAVSTVYPTTTGTSYSSHAILELHFHAIQIGTSQIDLYGTHLSDSLINPITHTVFNGSITVTGIATVDLTVTGVNVLDNGCSIYANDTYAGGATYYYPVEVTVWNVGTVAAGSFYVKLDVYWVTGSLAEASQEILVAGLGAGQAATVNFTSLFHPLHTGYYRLTAAVDSRNEISESDETNNVLTLDNVLVTVMGDLNGDGAVNILDAVRVSLAWGGTPADPYWNVKADLNHDGRIDLLDASRLSLWWGQRR